MKRLALLLAALGLLGLGVAPVVADDTNSDTVTIMIMKHLCTEADIKTAADFNAVEETGDAAFGTVAGLVNTVLACPTTGQPGDDPSDGIAAPRTDYDFTVTDSEGNTFTLDDGDFQVGKLCETDVNLDADGDGNISAGTCLDISHYAISGVAKGEVTISETNPPSGFVHGTLRFTPDEIDGNNDADSLQGDLTDEPIVLDTTGDKDGMVMLHVYNFEMSQPATDTLEAPGGSTTSVIPMALALLLLVGALGIATSLRTAKRP